MLDLNPTPASTTGLWATGPQDIAWYTPASCYWFDWIDAIGAGGSGAMQVWSLGLSGGGGGGGWGRVNGKNTYPGEYNAYRAGTGGAGQSLAGQGAQRGGIAGVRCQVDNVMYVEGGWGGNTNGVGGMGGRGEYSQGCTWYSTGGRGGNVSGNQAASGGGGAAGVNGGGFNGIDGGGSSSTNGGQADAGTGAGGGQGNVGTHGGNGYNGFEYASGTLGSGGGGGAAYCTVTNCTSGAGGWYGGGGGADVQTYASGIANTGAGAGGLIIVQYRVYANITVSSVSPSGGGRAGGNWVGVNGSGFENISAVYFGGALATGVTVYSDALIGCYTPAHAAGAVDVVVVGTAGMQGVGYGVYTYYDPVTVTSVSPNNGPISGGQAVTVYGSAFLNGVFQVDFGSGQATGISVINDNALTCYTPASGSPGAVNVTVHTSYGDGVGAGLYTYAPPPSVGSVTPNFGDKNGSTNVVILGANMDGATNVKFGGVDALTFQIINSGQINAITPPHAPGKVDVTVTNQYGTGTGVGAYTYVLLPTFVSCTPNQGPQDLPTHVTITGANFTGATAVLFGGVSADNIVVVSDTQITCDTRPHLPGTVDITVTTPNGTGTGVSMFSYLTVLTSPLNRAIIMP